MRLSVTTPRQPFWLVLRSTRAPPNNMFSQRFITCTWYLLILLCKNTKIWRSTNYSSITLQYDLSHRVPTFDLWMLAPQERKVVFHEQIDNFFKLFVVLLRIQVHRTRGQSLPPTVYYLLRAKIPVCVKCTRYMAYIYPFPGQWENASKKVKVLLKLIAIE